MAESKRKRRRRHQFTMLPDYKPRRRDRGRERKRQRRATAWARIRRYGLGITAAAVLTGIATALWLDQRTDWNAQVDEAAALLTDGTPDLAAAALKDILRKAPDHARGRWQLGLALIALEDGAAAFKEIERAETLGFRDPQLFPNKLVALLIDGKFAQALRQLVFVSELESDPVLMEIRARAQLGLGRVAEARKTLERVVELAPDRPSSRLWLGRVALRQSDIGLAGKQAQALLDSGSPSAATWVLKGEIDLANDEPERAELAFRAALSSASAHIGAKLGLARALLIQNRAEPAEAELADVLTATKDHPLANFLAANARSMQKDLRGAIKLGQGVLSRFPTHHPSLLLVAALHLQESDLPQAELLLRRAVKNRPDDPRAQKMLASVELATGQAARAADRLEGFAMPALDDAELIALLAAAYVQSGRVDQAVSLLRDALERHDERPELLTELGVAELTRGNTHVGEQTLQRVITLSPRYTRPYLILGTVYLESGRPKDAAKTLGTLVGIDKDNAAGWHQLGLAQIADGDEAIGRTSLENALAHDPGYVPALWSLARSLQVAGNTVSARDRYREILRVDPGHTSARYELALLALRSGEKTAAKARLRTVLAEAPTHRGAVEELVRIYLSEGRTSQALRILRAAWRQSPNGFAEDLADMLAATGDYAGALGVLDQSESSPDRAARHRILNAILDDNPGTEKATSVSADYASESDVLANAVHALANGRLLRAEALARTLERRFTQSESAELVRADIYITRGDVRGAVAAFENALARNSSPGALRRAVDGWRNLDETPRAQALLQARVNATPFDVAAQGMLAQIALTGNRFEGASSHYESLLTEEPDNPQALNNLAWAYYRQGDARALSFAESAYELAPDAPAIADTYGWLLVEIGQVREGRKLLESALEAAPKDPFARYHLAVAYSRTEQNEKALALLHSLKDDGADFPDREAADALHARLDPTGR